MPKQTQGSVPNPDCFGPVPENIAADIREPKTAPVTALP